MWLRTPQRRTRSEPVYFACENVKRTLCQMEVAHRLTDCFVCTRCHGGIKAQRVFDISQLAIYLPTGARVLTDFFDFIWFTHTFNCEEQLGKRHTLTTQPERSGPAGGSLVTSGFQLLGSVCGMVDGLEFDKR